MTTTVHAGTPASDSLVGRVNALICAVLDCEPSRVLPTARLREDLGGHPLSLARLAMAIEIDLGLDPVMWRRPEERWATVSDCAEWVERRTGRAA